MSKKLNTNFTINAPFPIDSRLQVNAFVDLDAIAVKYDRMVVQVLSEDKDYTYYQATNSWVEKTGTNSTWGTITGNIADQTDLIAKFNEYALVGHTHPQQPPLAHTHLESEITDLNKYTQEEVDALTSYKVAQSTGLLVKPTGGVNVTNTLFDIGAGIGVKHVWNEVSPFAPPVNYLVEFGPFGAIAPTFLGTHPATYIGVSYDEGLETSTLVQASSPYSATARRDIIPIGIVKHVGAVVDSVEIFETTALESTANIFDVAEAVGSMNLDGNIYSAVGANLTLTRSSGYMFRYGRSGDDYKNPSKVLTLTESPVDIEYVLQDGTTFYAASPNVDPDNYDLAGVRTATPAGKWTSQKVFLMPDSSTKIEYGQVLYDSKLEAITNLEEDVFVDNKYVKDNGIVRAYILIEQGTTVLNDPTKAIIVRCDKFGRAIKPLQSINEDKNYVHTQGVSSDTWVIAHNLGKFPSVRIKDDSDNVVYGDIVDTDINNLTISFTNAFTGTAILN